MSATSKQDEGATSVGFKTRLTNSAKTRLADATLTPFCLSDKARAVVGCPSTCVVPYSLRLLANSVTCDSVISAVVPLLGVV